MPADPSPQMDKSADRTRLVASGCLALATRVKRSETGNCVVRMATAKQTDSVIH